MDGLISVAFFGKHGGDVRITSSGSDDLLLGVSLIGENAGKNLNQVYFRSHELDKSVA